MRADDVTCLRCALRRLS